MLPDVCKGDGQIMAPCHHILYEQMFNKLSSMLSLQNCIAASDLSVLRCVE